MQKMLQILPILIVAGSTTAGLLATSHPQVSAQKQGNNQGKTTFPNKGAPTSTASQIAAKIINKTIYYNPVLGNQTSNKSTSANILNILKSINSDNVSGASKNLTSNDLGSISLASATITTKLQTVVATIHGANQTTTTVPLQIALNPQLKQHHYTSYFDMGQLFKYNLADLATEQQIPVLTAAFLQHTSPSTNPADPVGWSWAGTSIDKNPKDQPQYQALQQYQAAGGRYYISFGGANGTPGWSSQFHYSVSQITKSLQYVIDLYHPLGLDFDIEGGQSSDTAGNTNLFKAVAALAKANPKLSFSYTIAVAPNISADALNPNFEASFDAMLQVPYTPILNLMTMDYGVAESNMYKPAIQCDQMLNKKILAHNNWGLTNQSDVNAHMGLTPMIGQNDSRGELFTKNDMMLLAHYETINQMPRFSSWSLTRDNGTAGGSPSATFSGSGEYQAPYEFSHLALNTYGDSSQSDQPVSGKLLINNFAVYQDAIAIDWNKISHANYYSVDVDGSPITKLGGASTGYAYYKPNLTKTTHTIHLVAYGAQGSQISSNTITVNTAQTALASPLLMYNQQMTYQGHEYLYYQQQVNYLNYYKDPATKFADGQLEPLGPLSKFSSSLSPTAQKDFANNTLPPWYFTNLPK